MWICCIFLQISNLWLEWTLWVITVFSRKTWYLISLKINIPLVNLGNHRMNNMRIFMLQKDKVNLHLHKNNFYRRMDQLWWYYYQWQYPVLPRYLPEKISAHSTQLMGILKYVMAAWVNSAFNSLWQKHYLNTASQFNVQIETNSSFSFWT